MGCCMHDSASCTLLSLKSSAGPALLVEASGVDILRPPDTPVTCCADGLSLSAWLCCVVLRTDLMYDTPCWMTSPTYCTSDQRSQPGPC